jgi:uncharacterized protein with beta-barrel porin domain
MKRVGVVELLALGLGMGAIPSLAVAQSVDIPLNYTLNTINNYGQPLGKPTLILTINIGVGGGPAQAYAFDTGSSVFVAPPGTFTAANSAFVASTDNVETYGDPAGAKFSGNIYTIPVSALTFYATTGATTGGVSLGTTGSYTVGSYIDLNGIAPPPLPFGTAAVGAFGASGLAFFNKSNSLGPGVKIPMGGVLGQTVAPNGTTAGFIVSANGQSLAALNARFGINIPGGPVTGAPQAIQTVPTSVTSCNPCLTVGLTPALLAQFLPINTVNAIGDGNLFPNSNIPDINKFPQFFFTLGSGATQSALNVSVDSGFIDFKILPPHTNSPSTVTIVGNIGGTEETFTIASSQSLNSPFTTSGTGGGDGILGTGFFVANSVLYDLAGQVVAYSPNFVTDANITTTKTQPLVIDGSSVPLGLAGVISGPGGVSINAGGSATLSGTNTYAGPTSVSGTGAYLALIGPGSISASSGVSVSAGGIFDISSVAAIAMIQSLSGDGNGLVFLGNNYLALSNASGVFAGSIGGSGGLMLLSGTETLSGTNTYAGLTLVTGGTLNVTGSIANSVQTVIGPAGALTGTGTVGPLAVLGGGTFAPAFGMPGQAMTVAGSVSFSPGSIYAVQLNGSTTPPVNIDGIASLAGTVAASYVPGSTIHKQYDILHSNGLLGTTFSGVTLSSLPGFSASLSYSATDAFLNLNAMLESLTLNLGTNAQHVAHLLDATFNSTGTLPAGLTQLFFLAGQTPASGGSPLANALTQVSGETATGAQQTTFSAMSQFINLLTDPFTGRGNGIGGATGTPGYAEEDGSASAYAARQKLSAERDAYAMFTKAPLAKVYEPRWSVWASAFGGSQSTDGNTATGSNSTTSTIAGTAVGADYLLSPRTIAGFALAGGGTSFSVVNSGSGRSDLFQAGAYIRHVNGPAYVSAALAYGWQDITTDRMVTILGADRLRAEFNASAWSGRIEGGYRFVAPVMKGVGITPYAAAQFTTFELPAYAESAVSGTPAFALGYGAQSVTDSRSELGVRTDKSFAMSNGVLTLRSRLAWAHDYNPDRAVAATFQALPGASFVVNGAAQASDSALTTASAEMKWINGWSAMAAFEGEFSEVTQSYAGKGVLRYTW